MITPFEAAARTTRCLNGDWRFQPMPVDKTRLDEAGVPLLPPPVAEGWCAQPLTVPSPWNGNAWGGHTNRRDPATAYRCDGVYYPDYPEEWIHAQMGWLSRTFTVETLPTGRATIRFEAVAGEAAVYLNGRLLGTHFDNYLAFELEATDALKVGENELLVGVRGHRLFDVQSPTYKRMLRPYPVGSNTEGMCGIWQDVYLCTTPAAYIDDVFVQPYVAADRLAVEVTVTNTAAVPVDTTVAGTVCRFGGDQPVLTLPETPVSLPAGGQAKVTLEVPVAGALDCWSPDSPALYTVELTAGEDARSTRFGWREFAIHGEELHLNGAPIHLVGDICHPFGPYMFSREFVATWYGMIKEVGGNAVRLHAQIYPTFFLEVADEMGLAVLDETALFGSNLATNLEEPAAWPRFEEHYDGLVKRDRNHPSVFGWSFGNELFALFLYDDAAARDQDRFYEQLIAFGQRSKALDPTRDFITCDGDYDLRGTLPVWSRHFGHGIHPLPADVYKPLVIGESGGTYYARPIQLSEFNGEESFRSYAGRNRALGIDVYANIRHMVKKLAYFSPSELVWFGLEPLPYGYHDYSRLPDLTDGIFFEKPAEGTPGLWFRRLPPFAGTLNAGFDPALPAYRPLDMYHAMKDALTFDPRFDGRWQKDVKVLPAAPVYDAPRTLRLVGDRAGAQACALTAMGLQFTKTGEDTLIDGDTATAEEALAALRSGEGTALVLVGDTLPAWLSGLALTDRTATQLDRAGAHPFVDSLSIADMYTAEEKADKFICRHGLAVEAPGVRPLLAAGEIDWSQFNNVEERVKCGAAFLYEKLHKPAGTVLVKLPLAGERLVCTVSTACTESHIRFWRRLFGNMGWPLGEAPTLEQAEAALHDLLLNGPVD